MTRTGRQRGFTLIEIMITLAILAVVAAIGFPSYTRYVTSTSREAAKTEMLQLGNLQEKIYLNSSSYATSITTAYNGRSDGGLGVTSGRTRDDKYALSITPTAGPTQVYTITATPVSGTSQANDGAITLSSDGTRAWGSKTW